MRFKVVGLESDYRFSTALEAGKHGVDLAIIRMKESGDDSVRMWIEETADPVNAIHTGNGAQRLS
jgi:hypothetical protein